MLNLLAITIVLSDANVLLSSHALGATAFFFSDMDVSATLVVPSSALDGDSLVGLDLGGLCGLVVLVGGGKDTERNPWHG